MALKGTTKIELTNVHTGQKEVVEHHNMITNVMLIFNIKGGQLYVNYNFCNFVNNFSSM